MPDNQPSTTPSFTPQPIENNMSPMCQKSQKFSSIGTSNPNDNKSKCQELADSYNRSKAELERIKKQDKISDLIPGVAIINAIGNAVKADNKIDTQSLNLINRTINSQNISEITQSCSNINNTVQKNSIRISPECIKVAGESCAALGLSTDDAKLQCIKDNTPKVSNVSQSNQNDGSMNCTINNVISQLTAQSDSTAVQTMARLLQEASGPATKNSTDGFQCSEVNTNINSTQYSSNISCCMNKLASRQLNEIDSCGIVTDSTQSNVNNQMAKCVLGSSTEQSTKQTSSVNSSNELDAEQKASMNMSMSFSFFICCCVILIILAGAVALPKILEMLNKKESDNSDS